MNGGHDLGGMHGLGSIRPEPEAAEPVFHADWERRVFGMVRVLSALGRWNGDMSRFARERQHPADYLRHSYYENWLAGLERLLVETGLVTAEELVSGKASGPVDGSLGQRRLMAEQVSRGLVGSPSTLPVSAAPPRFQRGDRVRAVNRHPAGHTREPRYVRGRMGTVHEYHGTHLFPDLSAEGVRAGRHLYTVRFEGSELWGRDGDFKSAVYVDLWEDYLEPAP